MHAECSSEMSEKKRNLATLEWNAMIGARPRDRERALDRVESVHRHLGTACGGEVFGMTESARLRHQKVTSERENLFRSVQMVERPQRFSREKAGPGKDVLVSVRLVHVPGGARKAFAERPSQHGE